MDDPQPDGAIAGRSICSASTSTRRRAARAATRVSTAFPSRAPARERSRSMRAAARQRLRVERRADHAHRQRVARTTIRRRVQTRVRLARRSDRGRQRCATWCSRVAPKTSALRERAAALRAGTLESLAVHANATPIAGWRALADAPLDDWPDGLEIDTRVAGVELKLGGAEPLRELGAHVRVRNERVEIEAARAKIGRTPAARAVAHALGSARGRPRCSTGGTLPPAVPPLPGLQRARSDWVDSHRRAGAPPRWRRIDVDARVDRAPRPAAPDRGVHARNSRPPTRASTSRTRRGSGAACRSTARSRSAAASAGASTPISRSRCRVARDGDVRKPRSGRVEVPRRSREARRLPGRETERCRAGDRRPRRAAPRRGEAAPARRSLRHRRSRPVARRRGAVSRAHRAGERLAVRADDRSQDGRRRRQRDGRRSTPN